MGSSFLLILIALSGRLWQYQGIKELAQTAGQMFQFKVTPVIHSCPHFAAELFTFEMNVKCLSTSHAWGGGKPARNENSNRKLPTQLYNTPNNNWVICIRYFNGPQCTSSVNWLSRSSTPINVSTPSLILPGQWSLCERKTVTEFS